MSKSKAQWAVLPLIKVYEGDMRRSTNHYMLAGGFSITDYNIALWAKRELCNRGIACFVDMVGV